MPGIIGALRDAANPFSILTKGTLILRDLDLLAEAAEVTEVGLNVSVGFVDKAISRSVEPGTPSPERRLGVCAALTDRGLRCGVLMGPVLPFLTDSPGQLEATVRLVAEAGAPPVPPLVPPPRPRGPRRVLHWARPPVPRRGAADARRRRGQAARPPGHEAPVQVGRVADAEVLQGCRREARGIALGAEDDDVRVVAGLRQPGGRGRVETPFQDVALHDQGAGDLALGRALGGRADVDENRADADGALCLLRAQPVQPRPRVGQYLLDRPSAGRRTLSHHPSTVLHHPCPAP